MIAFERVEEMRPCSWNQPRSRSMRRARSRSQSRPSSACSAGVGAALDRVGERLEDHALDVRARRRDHVVLAVVEDVERVVVRRRCRRFRRRAAPD